MAPIEDGRAAAARMPRADFVVLPGIGHFPFPEAPEETARLITAFIAASPVDVAARTAPAAAGSAHASQKVGS